jgi:hypothetical protein
MRSASVALLVLLAAACNNPTSVSDDALSVRRHPGDLELRNASSRPLSYFVVERETAAITLDWRPCTGPRCPIIDGHAAVSVPDSAIFGFTASAREAIVFWWRAVADSTALVPPESIHSLVTPL